LVAVNAKKAPATQITKSIDLNEEKIAAYQGLQTALNTLSTDLASLSNSVVNSLSTSAFAERLALITSTGSVDSQSELSMSLKPGAPTGSHTLTIGRIATAEKVAGAVQPSQTASLGYSGTFSLGLAGGDTENISVTNNMSLQDVADAINAQTSTTNVQASIIQVTGNSYQLVLTGTQDAVDITTSSVSGDDVLNKLGVTDSTGAFPPTSVLQTAQTAEFTLDGISLTRNTNDIDDVLTGATFNLLQATQPNTSINIDIEPNTDVISSAIGTFVTDYNAVRDAVLAQQATNSDGTAASSAVLFGDGTVRSTMDQLQSILSTSVGGMALGNMGLEFDATNHLVVAPDATTVAATLPDALANNLSGVMTLLTAETTTSSSQLTVLNTGTSPQSFNLDVQVDSSGKLVSASVNGNSSLFTISAGNTIVGAGGTPYSGMAFSYTGSTSQSIAVTSTMGLAAQIAQAADEVGGSSQGGSGSQGGTLQTLISGLQDQDTTMQSKVNDINSAAATYQAQLKLQYANYQAEIESANTTLNYLKAVLNAGSNNQ
jgi:flagellar hook-associated protein 2